MTIEQCRDVAFSLYDGGWRWADQQDMQEEYGLTPDETEKIADTLFNLQCDSEQLRLCSEWNCEPENLDILIQAQFGDFDDYEDHAFTISDAFKRLLGLSQDPEFRNGGINVICDDWVDDIRMALMGADCDIHSEVYNLSWITGNEVT